MRKLGQYTKEQNPKIAARRAYLTNKQQCFDGFIEVRESRKYYTVYFRKEDRVRDGTVEMISTEDLELWTMPDTVIY